MKTKDYFWCAHYHDLVTEMIRGERGRLPPPPRGRLVFLDYEKSVCNIIC